MSCSLEDALKALAFSSHSKYSGSSQQEFMGCYQRECVISSVFLWISEAVSGLCREPAERDFWGHYGNLSAPFCWGGFSFFLCCKKMRQHGTLTVVDFKTSTYTVACFPVIWSLLSPLQNVCNSSVFFQSQKKAHQYIFVESTGTTLHWTRISIPVGYLWPWFTSWVLWDATETLM